jgi:hypothetical protein
MIRFAAKSVFLKAVCVMFAVLAPNGLARAGGSPFSECRKWVDTGEDMRCFDCYQMVGAGAKQRWLNVCSTYEPNGRGSGSD